MPKLFLIPCPIAENALHTLPPQVQATVRTLDTFLVERAKTARYFVKIIDPARPIQDMTFVEMDAVWGGDARQSEAGRVFLQAIEQGKDVGVLSEAGCPGIADPGAGIVALAHQSGVQVVPLAGPSSILLALMASGMNGQRFAFHGYLSPKRPVLARDLRHLETLSRQHDQTQIFIETPYRSQMVLEVALGCLQPSTLFGVAQDLTGKNEFVRSLRVRDWVKSGPKNLEKLPCVFLIYGK